MDATLVTLIVYQLLLVGVGFWAQRRTVDTTDFWLGGRNLGASVAAISASASSSSAWSLLGVSGAAYTLGGAAIWLLPSVMLGFWFNWTFVAPRLMHHSRLGNSVSLNQFLTESLEPAARTTIRRLIATIIIFSFIFYVAAQFQAAGKAFESAFALRADLSIVIGGTLVLAYVLLGGFWAVSVTDTIQGLLMVIIALILPVVALAHIGVQGLWTHLLSTSWTQGAGISGIGFAIGLLGIGFGYPGQPHVVNRFMALRDERALRYGRRIALSWAVVLYTGMLICGWSARIMLAGLEDAEQSLFQLSEALLPTMVAGVLIAAVLSAIMSTADSQLHVAGSAVNADLEIGSNTLTSARLTITAVTIAALLLALYAPQDVFSRVLFAWHALGSSLGPILIVRLCHRTIPASTMIAAICLGFFGTVILSLFPNSPGDIAERFIPFILALIWAWAGSHVVNRGHQVL